MKQTLLRVSTLLGVLVLFGGLSQTVLAEESVVPEVKTEATTETTGEALPTESTEATVASTTFSSETEVESDSDSSVTKEDVKTIVDDVESLIKEQVGEVKEVDESLFNTTSGKGIRNLLLSEDYGITEAELNKYTDQQLENTMVLFERYNYDYTGLDMGSYIRILKALYSDKSLSWEAISPQLAFVPSNFKSFAEMIPQVDALQAYVKALYPSNSSFLPMRSATNEELVAVLQKLETFEQQIKADKQTLPAGRIIMIINGLEKGNPTDTTDTSTSTTDSKKGNPTPIASSETPKKADENKGGLLKLPQTGEEKAKWAVSILGIVLVLGVVIFLVRRNKGNKHNESNESDD